MKETCRKQLLGTLVLLLVSTAGHAQSGADRGWEFLLPRGNPEQALLQLDDLEPVAADAWDESAVRRVLQAFAFGGMARDQQIRAWADLAPSGAIVEMLDFNPVNFRLSPPDPGAPAQVGCESLTELQTFWSSDDPGNPMGAFDRPYHAHLSDNGNFVSPIGPILTWARAMHTRGCNPFLHRMAFYLTNYHASIHVENAGVVLIREYYDDMVAALAAGADFPGLMYAAARNGAVAWAYGHALNYVDPRTGVFHGNDDFAREYFQLLFGIQGTTEDPAYHETVTIEHQARLLTGMLLDMEPDRFGSPNRGDWLLSEIDFTDHRDAGGRQIWNQSAHYDFRLGALSCLEILHQQVCGATADAKLRDVGLVAAAHPESLANTPVKLVRFFADSVVTPDEAAALRSAWIDANNDVLRFLRSYAVSTQFHDPGRVKRWSAFERNLIVHNATVLDNSESFARPFYAGPVLRMVEQGALVFAPIRDVFGGQTGEDAANDRYVFKNAWAANVENPEVLALADDAFLRGDGGRLQWRKDWRDAIPPADDGTYRVKPVAEWLWNRFIADGGRNFDIVARSQVYSLLATGFDFAAVVNPEDLDATFTSAELGAGEPAEILGVLASMEMDFNAPGVQENVGMAVNFITMLPHAFAAGGTTP